MRAPAPVREVADTARRGSRRARNRTRDNTRHGTFGPQHRSDSK
ncbi:hypothetical protein HMPREF0591_2832 [Mycobacterium parascrofulaceum ATCC BAA-614]|uniref:Uncharacterized protein n=1 Tax=Mycobacterium parascrofulaceum ATCC BAA-614 TaxID=525368 RepID=D5P9I8_9MYCO|nr:hypothetical protein HMPREF0591_2832 [Mycobacterium parascrofulaceum ATCC BAA-614]